MMQPLPLLRTTRFLKVNKALYISGEFFLFLIGNKLFALNNLLLLLFYFKVCEKINVRLSLSHVHVHSLSVQQAAFLIFMMVLFFLTCLFF